MQGAGPGEATLSCQQQPQRQGAHPPVDRRDRATPGLADGRGLRKWGFLKVGEETGSQARTPEAPSAGGGGGGTVGQGLTPPTRSRWKQSQHPPGVAATLVSPHPLHPLKGPDSSLCNDGRGQAAATALSAGQRLGTTTCRAPAASLRSSLSRADSGLGPECPVPTGPPSQTRAEGCASCWSSSGPASHTGLSALLGPNSRLGPPGVHRTEGGVTDVHGAR